MRLLLVEDEAALRRSYASRLRSETYVVEEARSLYQARMALRDGEFDGVILDRQLPDGDGLQLLADIPEPDRTAILMISGVRCSQHDRVDGLKAGVDDYATKPLLLDELAIRMNNLILRMRPAAPPADIRLGRVTVDRARREVLLDGAPVESTPTEYRVIEYLAVHGDRVVEIEELLEHCWDRNGRWRRNPVHSQISRLRGMFAGALRIPLRQGAGYTIEVIEPEPVPGSG